MCIRDRFTVDVSKPEASAPELSGTAGSDSISGSDGDDVIRGLGGDDTLQGGLGNDIVFGDAGHDTYLFGPGLGKDIFVGGDGNDAIQLVGVDGGPSDSLEGPGGWVLALDGGRPDFTQTDNALEFDSEASGVIVFADNSELEFHDVVRVEW